MSKPQHELADVIRRFIGPYKEQFAPLMLPSHHRALQDITRCMTEAMGGGRYHCHDCHETFWRYHGCRNRSCPKCHGRQIANWLKNRYAEILPCRYFHLVATVPSELRSLFLRHQRMFYGLLMKSAADAVRDLAAEKRYVGAEVGILAVLHTWTGRLHHHPHVHMLVTGGGVTEDGTAWHEAPNDFLVPVRRLSSMIAKRFAEALQNRHPDLFKQIPVKAWNREWCSYSKPYGTGKDAVLRYLARYVFRIAITNHRLVSMDESHVTFRYKDRGTDQWKTERLEGVQFLRRFLLHVLPKGFHKVRYYGLWHPCKRYRQAQARLLLELTAASIADTPAALVGDLADEALAQSSLESHGNSVKCPKCGGTNVIRLETIRRRKAEMLTWPMRE
ncbi:MAG: transposase [Candidatus Promineifilaceae bacterium]|jgi:Zn finger protein HypA/HybF involved in hydrogenase expression